MTLRTRAVVDLADPPPPSSVPTSWPLAGRQRQAVPSSSALTSKFPDGAEVNVPDRTLVRDDLLQPTTAPHIPDQRSSPPTVPAASRDPSTENARSEIEEHSR